MRPRRVPDLDVLAEYADRRVRDERSGELREMTYGEMAADWESRSGIAVSSETFRRTMVEAGLRDRRRPRHRAVLPWTLKRAHAWGYFAVRLRLLARQVAGEQLVDNDRLKVINLRRHLREAEETSSREVSIMYVPDDEQGFHLVTRRPGDIRVADDIWIVPPEEDAGDGAAAEPGADEFDCSAPGCTRPADENSDRFEISNVRSGAFTVLLCPEHSAPLFDIAEWVSGAVDAHLSKVVDREQIG